MLSFASSDDLWLSGETSFDNFTIISGDGPSDNLTLSCAERTLATSDLSLYSAAVTNIVKAFRFLYFILLLIFGILLNALVVYLVAKHKNLQRLSYGLALQVMVANIGLATALALPQIVTTLAGKWVLGSYLCVAIAFTSGFLVFLRMGIMLVFVMDRFLSVFAPYFYLRHRVKIAISLSVLSWILLLLLRLPTLPGILDCYGFTAYINACGSLIMCNRKCSIYGVLIMLVGLMRTVVPTVLYTALYCKAKYLQRETATVAGGADKEQRDREHQATITFFLLFIILFAIAAPTIGVQIVLAQFYPNDQPRPGIYIVQVVIGGITSISFVTDPIVILRDRDMRATLSGMRARLVQKCCPRHLANTNTNNELQLR